MRNGERSKEIFFYILSVGALILLSIVVYKFVVLPAPPSINPISPPKNPDVLDKLGPRTAVAIIVTMIFLLAVVFWFFISFGRRLSMRTYLGPLARDAIYRAEIARQEDILREDLRVGRFAAGIDVHEEQFRKRFRIPMEASSPALRPGVEMDELGGTLDPWSDPWSSPGFSDYSFSGDSADSLWRKREEANQKNDTKLVADIDREINRRFIECYRQAQRDVYLKALSTARDVARKRASELLPQIDVSAFGGGWTFVLEFTTIIFIVFAVLALGIVGVLASEPIATILAAIAGYVLGKSTTFRGAGGEEIRRSTEEPKVLLDTLTKQEEIKSLRDEEKINLRREKEDLQRKLALILVKVPNVKGMIADLAETKIKEQNLIPKKHEVEHSVADVGKVFGQEPEADAEVDRGSTVVIFVAKTP